MSVICLCPNWGNLSYTSITLPRALCYPVVRLASTWLLLAALVQVSGGEVAHGLTRSFPPDYFHHDHGKRSINEQGHAQPIEAVHSAAAAGYLLADATDRRLNLNEPLDKNVSIMLDLNGPDMRPSRNYHDYQNISVDMSMRAWSLMHEHASNAIKGRVHLAWPVLDRVMNEAKTSPACMDAIRVTLQSAGRLESWAVKLILSWGTFPTSGLFEGSYGDVGSFHTCVDIKSVAAIDHAHYCSVAFRPVMPSHEDYELVLRPEPRKLREMFERRQSAPASSGPEVTIVEMRTNSTIAGPNQRAPPAQPRDAFTDLLEHAQYHHYVYYKWGTCWPIACSPFDVKRIAKVVGRENVLLSGPVKCFSTDRTDYEQEYDEFDVGGVPANSSVVRPNATSSETKKKRRLVISTWDKNDGIFVWKPHFYKAHKVALWIVVSITIFILTMTAIDLFANRIPRAMPKLMLALKGLPLDYDPDRPLAAHYRHRRQGTTILTFAEPLDRDPYCPGSQSPVPRRKHLGGGGFAMVPTEVVAATAFDQQADANDERDDVQTDGSIDERAPSLFMSLVDDCSVFTNLGSFFRVSEGQLRNDILCLNGIRCITMVWIIMTHTMMYNDWSQFGRTRDVEKALKSLISQPLFNGSYLVDTFFLMSGLLSAYTAFKHSQGVPKKFNSLAYILGRWLRLTPQILFVSLLFIILPAMSYGPHWFPMVGEPSENCRQNWWINVLHLQAFYKKDEMCNFVTWWISIDFFYHFFALAVIWVFMLAGHRHGFASMAVIVLSKVVWQTKRHYELGLPPNVLSTIPQTGAMWTTMTLDFYWTPYTHSVPFFAGFYIGYLLALKRKVVKKMLNTRRALIGWSLSILLLLGQSYSTYWWVIGEAGYSRWLSTLFYGACSFIWAGSISWIIIACQLGYGGFVNRVLSWRVFIVLGKASYLVYLSHFQVLFLFFANQNLMLEPTTINMLYIIIGNILLATIWGIVLCTVYEIPWLKMHRRLMKFV